MNLNSILVIHIVMVKKMDINGGMVQQYFKELIKYENKYKKGNTFMAVWWIL